jgi:hypothetical protein
MKRLHITLLTIILTAAMSASASMTTYSGAALSGLDYVGPSDTGYVAGSPDLAHLYTSDSGVNGDTSKVLVEGQMGALSAFSASYGLYSSDVPTGDVPYWNITAGSGANLIHIISWDGTPLDSSSDVHVYNSDYSSQIYDHVTLSALDADGYGDLTVSSAGVEIGEWNNNGQTISAYANISSITVPTPVPETSTAIAGALLLLPFGASALRTLRKSRTA